MVVPYSGDSGWEFKTQVLDIGGNKLVKNVYGKQAGGYAGIRGMNIYTSIDDNIDKLK
jgi:hypothetical protein